VPGEAAIRSALAGTGSQAALVPRFGPARALRAPAGPGAPLTAGRPGLLSQPSPADVVVTACCAMNSDGTQPSYGIVAGHIGVAPLSL
jgi:hypothetical protein